MSLSCSVTSASQVLHQQPVDANQLKRMYLLAYICLTLEFDRHLYLQVGLQGVDNGAMRFTNVRIPRDNLLDRFATVDRGGKYSSPYSPSRRFAATLGELTGGRVGLTCGSLGVLKVR